MQSLRIPKEDQGPGIYTLLLLFQAAFYLAAAAGWYFENRMIRIKAFFIPYYFLFMNLSVFLGLRRLIRGSQTVNWARAKRAELTVDRLT